MSLHGGQGRSGGSDVALMTLRPFGQLYDPKKQGPTGKYFSMIFGRWIRVEAKNIGEAPTKQLRIYVRGSVF
jgi:hypothetical protein